MNYDIKCVELLKGEFFGTSDKLIEFRSLRAKQKTFFIDIDGTLLFLDDGIRYGVSENSVLPGTIEKLEEWKREGHAIILTTGRDSERREQLIELLRNLKIPYDELITGLPSGSRIVINDKKPYNALQKMAISIQIERNEGIQHISVDDNLKVISMLKGASRAKVYLVELDGNKFIRKYIRKQEDYKTHVEILKRQCEDLRRFEYYSPGLVPKITNEYDSNDEYYYDMEYLEDYIQMSNLDETTIQQLLPKIFARLKRDVYCYKKNIDGINWLRDYLDEKIYKRLPTISSFGDEFDKIISSSTLTINDIEVKGIKEALSEFNLTDVIPQWVSPIHGDLTLENVLFNITTGDFKLIDPAGSRYVDAFELDVAKCMQSFISKYEKWDEYTNIVKIDRNMIYIPKEFLEINKTNIEGILSTITNDKQMLFKRGMFFTATHLIRLIPFMIRKSKEKALFALCLSAYYLYYTMSL